MQIKIIQDTRRSLKDNTYPLYFRILYGGKRLHLSTGLSCPLGKYDHLKEVVKGDKATTAMLQHSRDEIARKLLTLKQEVLMEMPDVKLKGFLSGKQIKQEPTRTVEEFWRNHIHGLEKKGAVGNARAHLSSFTGLRRVMRLDVPFKEINYRTLKQAEGTLLANGASINTVSVYFRALRAVFNEAIKMELVTADAYPFRKFVIQKEKTTPRVMSLTQLQAYFALNLEPTNPLYHTWVMGKLIVLLRGINLVDLWGLTSANLENGRLVYKRSKTGKLYSIKVNGYIADELSKLGGFEAFKRILGFSTTELNSIKDVNRYFDARKLFNNRLKKLGQELHLNTPLTTYVFRYSYANIAKQLGFSKDLIAEALGHEYGNSVTGIYLELFGNSVLDDMNEKIIDAVLKRVD